MSTPMLLSLQIETFTKEDQEFIEEKLSILENQVEDLTTECFEAKKQLSSLGTQLEEARREHCNCEEERSKLLARITDRENEIDHMKTKYSHIKACRSKRYLKTRSNVTPTLSSTN